MTGETRQSYKGMVVCVEQDYGTELQVLFTTRYGTARGFVPRNCELGSIIQYTLNENGEAFVGEPPVWESSYDMEIVGIAGAAVVACELFVGPDLELCDTPTTNPHYILGDILIPRTSNFKRGDNVKLIVAYMDIGEPSCCMVAIGWIDPNGSRLRQFSRGCLKGHSKELAEILFIRYRDHYERSNSSFSAHRSKMLSPPPFVHRIDNPDRPGTSKQTAPPPRTFYEENADPSRSEFDMNWIKKKPPPRIVEDDDIDEMPQIREPKAALTEETGSKNQDEHRQIKSKLARGVHAKLISGESESENILPRMDYVLESIGKDPSFWTTSRTQQTASGEEHGRGAVRGDLKPRVAVVERGGVCQTSSEPNPPPETNPIIESFNRLPAKDREAYYEEHKDNDLLDYDISQRSFFPELEHTDYVDHAEPIVEIPPTPNSMAESEIRNGGRGYDNFNIINPRSGGFDGRNRRQEHRRHGDDSSQEQPNSYFQDIDVPPNRPTQNYQSLDARNPYRNHQSSDQNPSNRQYNQSQFYNSEHRHPRSSQNYHQEPSLYDDDGGNRGGEDSRNNDPRRSGHQQNWTSKDNDYNTQNPYRPYQRQDNDRPGSYQQSSSSNIAPNQFVDQTASNLTRETTPSLDSLQMLASLLTPQNVQLLTVLLNNFQRQNPLPIEAAPEVRRRDNYDQRFERQDPRQYPPNLDQERPYEDDYPESKQGDANRRDQWREQQGGRSYSDQRDQWREQQGGRSYSDQRDQWREQEEERDYQSDRPPTHHPQQQFPSFGGFKRSNYATNQQSAFRAYSSQAPVSRDDRNNHGATRFTPGNFQRLAPRSPIHEPQPVYQSGRRNAPSHETQKPLIQNNDFPDEYIQNLNNSKRPSTNSAARQDMEAQRVMNAQKTEPAWKQELRENIRPSNPPLQSVNVRRNKLSENPAPVMQNVANANVEPPSTLNRNTGFGDNKKAKATLPAYTESAFVNSSDAATSSEEEDERHSSKRAQSPDRSATVSSEAYNLGAAQEQPSNRLQYRSGNVRVYGSTSESEDSGDDEISKHLKR